MYGTLYICGTPIGNLEDITLRGLRTLKEVDLIAAEDTRQTIKLLNYYNIKTPLTSYHEHNKIQKGQTLIELLKEGKNIAVVSDAGMPIISDPGVDLVKLCYENNINITVIPGVTAVITAVALSGIGDGRYIFEGFLPTNKKQRNFVLEKIKTEVHDIVIYEAPHHLINTLKELYNSLGERNIAVIKEMTKKYEKVYKGNFSEVISHFEDEEPKGEFVIVIEGTTYENIINDEKKAWNEITITEHMEIYVQKGYDTKSAMKQVAKDRGVSKRDIYAYINNKN